MRGGRRGRRSVLLAAAALAAALLAACGASEPPGSTAASPTASAPASATAPRAASPAATSTPAPTPTPSIAEEVEAAYLAYWDAYSEAVLHLDERLVEGFAGGEELAGIRAEIAALRAAGVALRVVVAHDLLVVPTSATTAAVVDRLTNNSFYVDPVSKQPPRAEGGGELLRDTVFMEQVGGRWVAVRSRRDRSP